MHLPFLSDPQIEEELGRRVRRRRVERGLNQTELAERAGVTRRTVSTVENGGGCSLRTFVALLRALDSLQDLDGLLAEAEVSPIALTSSKIKERKRPYKPRGRKSTDAPWQWGDEKE